MIDILMLYTMKKTPLKNIYPFKSYEQKFEFSFCGYVHDFGLKKPKMVFNTARSTKPKFLIPVPCYISFDRESFEKLFRKGIRPKYSFPEKIIKNL